MRLSPFPPLHLTPEDERELERVAQQLVDEQVQLFHAHLVEDGGVVDPVHWQRVSQCEDVAVYQESSNNPCVETQSAHSDVATLLGVGTIAGDLDDAMYGVSNPTLREMKLKTSYVQDGVQDAAILATVVQPSVSDPFRSLVVKWRVKGKDSLVRKHVRCRDAVYLEATGIRQLSNGERLGYHVLHSVDFPTIGTLDRTPRGNLSRCSVYYQKTPYTIQLFMRGVVEAVDGITLAAVVKSAASVMVAAAKDVHCAEMKKLAWAVRRRRRSEDKRSKRRRDSLASPFCTTCQRRPLFGDSALSRARTCGICNEKLCRSCRLPRRLSFLDRTHHVVQEHASFCTRCVTEVLKKCAFVVASDEISVEDTFSLDPIISQRSLATPLRRRSAAKRPDGYATE